MKISLTAAIAIAAIVCTATTDAFSPLLARSSTRTPAAAAGIRSFTGLFASAEENAGQNQEASKKEDRKPGLPAIIPLEPVIEALDPKYKCTEPVGKQDFIVSRTGGPVKEELTNENLYKILMLECSDLDVNTVVWKCLGYRFDKEAEEWTAVEVFPKWKEKFPEPPDFIGMARIYSKEVDKPSLKSNQQLVKSVPTDNKQSLKIHLKSLGFTGYQYAELTPNKTRRAQCANWLLYYREELFGYTIEELKEKRRLKKEAEEAEKRRIEEETGEKPEEGWKYPLREVY